ncbi:glycoside hydrolase family 43 protein [Cercospora zeae-maydis SCOH1-5]|uniref:Glycoside hydrolase family 43 protein n=1 Tax=Cercospora zeae-maydis SCOH1-5 TaxID=717836 RepID=A0A6A6F2Y6_9PEZI|nr:glycoside hydrolase family 43 protein [Cercospora zeae-maydis SCOH1-5]
MYSSLTTVALAALSVFASITSAAPVEQRQANLSPVISTDFPDPSIIKVGDTWYAFASQSLYDFQNIKVQVATSKDFATWSLMEGYDALGSMAPWARPDVWAPSVHVRDDGKYIMYYSAVTTTGGDGRFHCVGTAVADSVLGPYQSNTDEPFACPVDQGGALDASYFKDGDRHFVLYKIDANALGNGGLCGNTVEPIKTTPIDIQEVQADGTTKIGNPTTILTNSVYDGPLVEAPYMIRNADGIYVLFFSSWCYTSDKYDVSYATSTSPTGPFEKSGTPLFITGTQGLIGPGGGSIGDDGTSWAMHGYASRDAVGGRRAMFVTQLRLEGRNVISS